MRKFPYVSHLAVGIYRDDNVFFYNGSTKEYDWYQWEYNIIHGKNPDELYYNVYPAGWVVPAVVHWTRLQPSSALEFLLLTGKAFEIPKRVK